MEREERRHADALDRYWDAIQRGESPVRADGVDEVAATVIQHLGQTRAAMSLGSTGRRIREDLAARARELEEARASASGTPALAPPLRLPATPTPSRPFQSIVQLTSALLLLLVLSFSALLLWPGRPLAEPPTVLPAPPDAADVLLSVTIPERTVPRWKAAMADLIHESIPPNSAGTIDAPMLRVEYTLKGQYAVESDSPIMVVPAGDNIPREMPPGTQIILNPGDTLISAPGSVSAYTNRESSPAEVLTWTVTAGASSTDLQPRSWGIHASESRNGITPRAGPIDFQLQRVVLEPDATFPASPDVLQMAVTVSENAQDYTVAKTRDGGRRNLGKEPVTLMVVTIGAAASVSLMP